MFRVVIHCAALLGSALLLLACDVAQHSQKAQTFRVRGVVQGVAPAQKQAVIEHEAIPDFMPAMTMNFDVPNPAVLKTLSESEGQVVEFTLQVRERSFRIVDARALAADAKLAGRSGLLPDSAPPAEEWAPAFALTDQSGRTLRLADLAGRTLLLDFIYTHCPGPCPILTAAHVELQKSLPRALRERVHFVSISLDPERDTPDVLRRYALARGVALSNWSFLTGPRSALEALWLDYGVGSGRSENGEIEHLVISFLIDAEGRILRRYLGVEHSIDALRADLERAAGVDS